MVRQKFITDFPVYTEYGSLPVDDGIAGIAFKNKGNTPILVNGSYPLDPGEYFSIPVEDNQEDATRYFWSFPPNSVASPKNLLVIIRKTYVD